MPLYKKNLAADGPEFYWIKRILERDNDHIYLVDRAMALSCIAAYMWQSVNRPFSSQGYVKDHWEAWNAFLNGDRSKIQQVLDTHIQGEELLGAIGKEELSSPAVRLRIVIYVIVTIVIVVGAFKVFRVF